MREVFVSGQVHGKVDWVSSNGKEFGTYVRVTKDQSTKCVLKGPCVEQALANKLITLGSLVTASGAFYARATGGYTGSIPNTEAVCDVTRFVNEPCLTRSRGSCHVNVKGVVMWVSDDGRHVKTFINGTNPGDPKYLCYVDLSMYLRVISDAGRAIFLESLRAGREYTATGSADSYGYITKGDAVPVLRVQAADFKLQG